MIDGGRQYIVVEVGTELGNSILQKVTHREAEPAEKKQVEKLLHAAEDQMGRSLKTQNLPQILHDNFEHPRWEDVAKRCLSCANCTMVCPTCFCSTVEDVTDLTGEHAERWRRWDSCFTTDFTKVAGGNMRMSTRTRYRQWLTHKLSNWVEQFGTMGCVGCGRCITWCPVGIDITAEATAIRETSMTTTLIGIPAKKQKSDELLKQHPFLRVSLKNICRRFWVVPPTYAFPRVPDHA
jgi:ferredoxin